MHITIGTDIVFVPRFAGVVQRTPEFLDKIFLPSEMIHVLSIQSLAARFAVKEAVMKALDRLVTDWHAIIINQTDSGRLSVTLTPDVLSCGYSFDVSVSHDGEYAFAAVICVRLLNNS